jgi:hypothetical protein
VGMPDSDRDGQGRPIRGGPARGKSGRRRARRTTRGFADDGAEGRASPRRAPEKRGIVRSCGRAGAGDAGYAGRRADAGDAS